MLFDVSSDNSGNVKLTPSAEGASSFDIDFGDGSEGATDITVGSSVEHIFTEGSFVVILTAKGLNDLNSTASFNLDVTFKAPENLVLTITNDEVKSKKVNVTLTADFATMYEYYPGVDGVDPVTANIGESLSYQYAEAGIYNVRVVAKGGAIETTELTQEFEVTAILQPTVSAPAQPDRPAATVISVFSEKYNDLTGTDFYPWWWQSTQYEEYDLNGDKMIRYSKVNYQGVQLAEQQDISKMEYMHIDVWTASPEFENLEISLISASNGEKPVLAKLKQDEWTSFDIPLTDWTDQGLTIADMHQLKFAINPYNGDGAGVGTILSGHKDVDMVSFTGSTRAGRLITKNAADTIKRVCLELGGKGGNIVFADSYPDAVRDGIRNVMSNSGQSCDAPTRMLVERSIYERAVKEAADEANKIKVDLASKAGDHIGPVTVSYTHLTLPTKRIV